MTTIENFPAHLVETAYAALDKRYAKVAKAAARSGQAAPERPGLFATAERSVLTCTGPSCGREGGISMRGKDCVITGCSGTYAAHVMCDLELTAGRPVLAGWEFLAVVEPLNGAALIRQVPGAELPEGFTFDAWRSGDVACDHCKASRRRLETFLVRATGDDAAIARGTIRQVGRNCLAAFLGGRSYASVVEALTWERLVREVGESGEGGGGWAAPSWTAEEFLTQACAIVRQDGYVSRKAIEANPGLGRTTGSATTYALTPPGTTFDSRSAWRQFHEDHPVEACDGERAALVLTWARTLTAQGEYEQNLQLVAIGERVGSKHAGILASAVAAYERAVEKVVREKRAQADRAASQHVGAEKDRLEVTATVERVADVDTDYGTLHIHTLRTSDGHALVWKTTSARLDVGWTGPIRATVKRHSEYKGERQTEVTRVDTDPQPKAPRKRVPKKSKPDAATQPAAEVAS
jgi:hypothetical protein